MNTYKLYKIRKITKNNKTGDSYGITIPTSIAHQYPNTKFTITPLPDGILFRSGAVHQ